MTSKYKVVKILAQYEDGNWGSFDCDATLSVSKNARKKGGYQNSQEWDEYHITWCKYQEDHIVESLPVEEVPTGVRAEDYLDDPNFCGIDHGVPMFREQKTQFDFDDFDSWLDKSNE